MWNYERAPRLKDASAKKGDKKAERKGGGRRLAVDGGGGGGDGGTVCAGHRWLWYADDGASSPCPSASSPAPSSFPTGVPTQAPTDCAYILFENWKCDAFTGGPFGNGSLGTYATADECAVAASGERCRRFDFDNDAGACRCCVANGDLSHAPTPAPVTSRRRLTPMGRPAQSWRPLWPMRPAQTNLPAVGSNCRPTCSGWHQIDGKRGAGPIRALVRPVRG